MVEFLMNMLILSCIFLVMTGGHELFQYWYNRKVKENRENIRFERLLDQIIKEDII